MASDLVALLVGFLALRAARRQQVHLLCPLCLKDETHSVIADTTSHVRLRPLRDRGGAC
jgi:hypothetical protein